MVVAQVQPADNTVIGGAVGFRGCRQGKLVKGSIQVVVLDAAGCAKHAGSKICRGIGAGTV